MGRITLNPIPHIDLWMTIIMPIITFFSFGFPMGGAKPVPVNPYNMKNPRTGMLKVSLAGVISNFILAIIFALLIRITRFSSINSPIVISLLYLLSRGVFINLLLCVFNLIPVPPLDGSKVLMFFLPDNAARKLAYIGPFGFYILMLFFVFFRGFYLILLPILIIYNILTGEIFFL
jgi:Zn-dependent protease